MTNTIPIHPAADAHMPFADPPTPEPMAWPELRERLLRSSPDELNHLLLRADAQRWVLKVARLVEEVSA